MECKDYRGQQISRLGMGNMRLPCTDGHFGSAIDYPAAEAVIDRAMAGGITYYDTAWVYHGGNSESFLGDALVSRYPRESFQLATKFNVKAEPDFEKVFETQLERLKTDYIDFYLIHAMMDNSIETYLSSGCIDYLTRQRELGRIRNLGFSSHATPDTLRRFVGEADWDFAQIQLNYLDWAYSTAREEYEILEAAGLPIVVMEPCRGRKLADLSDAANGMLRAAHPDWSIASWAFRWVRSLPQVQVVLSGMNTVEQVDDNVATFSDPVALSADDERVLWQACESFHAENTVPCTACRYCVDGCPMEIDIPGMLAQYNRFRLGSGGALERTKDLDGGMAADCVGCGQCVDVCPQGIEIPTILAEIAEKLA